MHFRMQANRNILLALTLLLVGIAGTSGAAAASTRRVLVLYSYSRLFPVNVEVDRGLDTVLEGAGVGPVRRFSEFLDSPEFYGRGFSVDWAPEAVCELRSGRLRAYAKGLCLFATDLHLVQSVRKECLESRFRAQ
jgi:hypothetical protein